MKFKPAKDNVFVLIEKRERKTSGGIFMPDTAPDNEFGKDLACGRVFDAGPGGWGYNETWEENITSKSKLHYFPMEVEVGDRVLMPRLAGDSFTVTADSVEFAEELPVGSEVRIVRCSELIGVVE